MVYIYFLTLFALLLLSLIINNFNIVAPQTVFTAGFVFQAVWTVCYYNIWDLEINEVTFAILLLGVFVFFITCFVIEYLFRSKDELYSSSIDGETLEIIEISSLKEWIYALGLLIFAIIFLRFVVKTVGGSLLSLSSISDSIGEFDRLSKFSNQYSLVRVPSLLNNLKTFAIASGYWFSYVAIHNYICSKKIKVVEILIIVLTAIISAISGSRTPLFMMIIAAATYGIMLMHGNKEIAKEKYIKLIFKVACVGLFFVVSFIVFGTILGRTITNNPLDYLFVYCGAEVKNLDLFIGSIDTIQKNELWGSQTFYTIITTIGEKVGFEGYTRYSLDIPFKIYNGNNLGNVFTTFYPYIYDFGYSGMIILTVIMGSISQFFFRKSRAQKKQRTPNIFLLSYGFICGCLLLSFFSNKFYEVVVSLTFVKYIAFWIIINIMFTSCFRIGKDEYTLNEGHKIFKEK